MLSKNGNPPEAVLKVLPEQSAKRRARMIIREDRGVLPNGSAGPAKAQIEFIVLIADERFVERSKSQQQIPSPAAIGDSVGEAGIVFLPEACASGGKPSVKPGGYRAFPEGTGKRVGGSAGVVRARSYRYAYAADDIFGWICRMGIQANDELSRCVFDSKV